MVEELFCRLLGDERASDERSVPVPGFDNLFDVYQGVLRRLVARIR